MSKENLASTRSECLAELSSSVALHGQKHVQQFSAVPTRRRRTSIEAFCCTLSDVDRISHHPTLFDRKNIPFPHTGSEVEAATHDGPRTQTLENLSTWGSLKATRQHTTGAPGGCRLSSATDDGLEKVCMFFDLN